MADASKALPDFFEKFQEIVFLADCKTSLEERKKTFFDEKDTLTKGLSALMASGDWGNLGAMLEVIRQFETNLPVSFFKQAQSPPVCEGLAQNQDKTAEALAWTTFARAERLYDNALTGENTTTYLDRHRFVENAIQLVRNMFPADFPWPEADTTSKNAARFIAQCYLLRSRLALPKGSDVPGKKLEAIAKAWEWAEKADNQINELKAEIALEQGRWDKNFTGEQLSAALTGFLCLPGFDIGRPVHRAAYDKAREMNLTGIKDHDDALCTLAEENGDLWLSLYQAKAAFRKKKTDLPDRLRAAATALEGVPLSYPLWDDTVDLLDKTAKAGLPGWEPAAIDAWEACQQEEGRLKLSVQIRWYWSRQAALYDLAFLAARNKKKAVLAAQVADSLKSRPTVKMIQAEKNLSKNEDDRKNLEKLLEIETGFAAGFHKNLTAARRDRAVETEQGRTVTQVDAQWSVVHFYISRNATGHAVIFNGSVPFPEIIDLDAAGPDGTPYFTGTWQAYQDWKAALRKAGDATERSNPALKALCDACGKMLAPILEKVTQENILFVPHGFLHLVPLHAALVNNEPLFKTKTCLFLPAWALYPQASSTAPPEGALLLTNWSGMDQEIVQSEFWTNEKKEECTPKECTDAINSCKGKTTPWQTVVFYCHGKANYLNPYQAALIMYNGLLTHQGIAREMEKSCLPGTRVVLTACETDLVYDGAAQTDEHLSLAAAFQRKNVATVCGTLFKCPADISNDIIKSLISCPEKPLHEIVRTMQRDKYNHGNDLYRVASYRVMGGPTYKETA